MSHIKKLLNLELQFQLLACTSIPDWETNIVQFTFGSVRPVDLNEELISGDTGKLWVI
jgi:starvation-inducible outer membrane lipoprotein